MYSLKNLLLKEPNAVKSAALAVLAALVVTGTIDLSGEATAAWGIAVELVLTLFYVRPATVTKRALEELE
jgi:hypothetical protein